MVASPALGGCFAVARGTSRTALHGLYLRQLLGELRTRRGAVSACPRSGGRYHALIAMVCGTSSYPPKTLRECGHARSAASFQKRISRLSTLWALARYPTGCSGSHFEIFGRDPLHARLFHCHPGSGQRTLSIYTPASILDHVGLKPDGTCIDCRPSDTKVHRKAGYEGLVDTALVEISSKPGRRLVVGLEEGRIAVHILMISFAHDERGVRN